MNYSEYLKNTIFKIVSQAANELDYPTYVVGGWVRDLLLEKNKKNIDIDFVCVGSGEKLAELVHKKLGNKAKYKVFKNFGTAMISFENNQYEFVGARKESYSENSRKPSVEKGTIEDDQNRRDFTINAMAIRLNQEYYGEFLDPFNGVRDLKNKIIRTPLEANKTFSDDPLRMVRAIRFACELKFEIETNSYKEIINNAYRLSIISQERITEELNKIIKSENPSYGFKLLLNTKLLKQFFPQMVALEGIEVINNHAHKDNFYHTLKVLDNIAQKTDNLWLRWAALLHDIGKPATKKYDKNNGWTFHAHEFIGSKMIRKIFKQLRLPLNDKMKYVEKLVLLHLRPIALAQKKVTDSAIRRLLFDAGNDIDDLMLLCDADITSKNKYKVEKYLNNFKLVRQKLKAVEEKDNIRNFQPPINGKEIMTIFNLPPGKEIGILKNFVKDAILDGKIENNKEQVLKLLKTKATELKIKF